MTTCGERIVEILEQRGVDTVFGIPGNHTLELYRGLRDSGINHITTRHEQGAGFMADGYARASGKPGVCFLISGPGFLNAATAISQAAADSVPLLIIASANPPANVHTPPAGGRLHELPDQFATAQTLCQACFKLTDPTETDAVLTAAFHMFAAQRPGPVYVEVGTDVFGQQAGPSQTHTPAPATPSGMDQDTLQEALQAIIQSKQPALLLGGGAQGCKRLATLAERLQAPVVNTVNAKGLVPTSHPLSVGGSPSLDSVRSLLEDSDLVIALGTEFGETDFDLLMSEPFQLHGQLLRVDIDAQALQHNIEADISLQGSVHEFVDQVLNVLPERNPAADVQTRVAQTRQAIQSEPHYHQDFAAFFAALQAAAPNAVLVGDSTRPTYYATWMYECEQPRSYFHSVSGFGTLGYAIPAAFGAACATERPVAALIGDGGAQFSLTELATAADQKLAVPVVVWSNTGYEEIANSLAARSIDTASTVISAPDFQHIARSYQLEYHAPSSPAELSEVLKTAWQAEQPTIIEVKQQKFVTSSSGEWYGTP